MAVLMTFLCADAMPSEALSITAGGRANLVLGQSGFDTGYADTNVFGARFASASSMHIPGDVSFDPIGQRLFVADSYNARILVYELSGGVSSGQAATLVLGQAALDRGFEDLGFSYGDEVNRPNASFGCGVGANACGLNAPMGLDYDPDNQRLFVADSGNNRVLIWDLSGGISDGMPADVVLGQKTLTDSQKNSQCGTGFGPTNPCGLDVPTDLVFEPTSQQLFVVDSGNHRVVAFDLSLAPVSGMAASTALGQGTLSTRVPHLACDGVSRNTIDACGLKHPYHVEVDGSGSRVFVYDAGASRILVFDTALGITTGMPAALVLGQQSFSDGASNSSCDGATSGEENTNACGLGVWAGRMEFSSTDQKLYVADSANHRVLGFDTNEMAVGDEAVAVIGQADFTTGYSALDDIFGGATSQGSLFSPEGLVHDLAGDRLFVVDSGNHRVLVFANSLGGVPLNIVGDVVATSLTEAPDGSMATLNITAADGDEFRVDFPAGTEAPPGEEEITVTISNPDATGWNLPTIEIQASLPPGATKNITIATGQFASICIVDHEDFEFVSGSTCNIDNHPHGFALPAPGTCAVEMTHGDPSKGLGNVHPVEICLAEDIQSITVRGLLHSGVRVIKRPLHFAEINGEDLGMRSSEDEDAAGGCNASGAATGLTAISIMGFFFFLLGCGRRRRDG